MSKKARTTKTISKNSSNLPQKITYEVTFNKIVDQKIQKLPQNIQDELNDFEVNNRKDAEKAIPRLFELKHIYPKIPLIYNFISLAYGFIDNKKQDQAIIENYKDNPKYLFARCHYAQLCLHNGEPEKIPEVFENKFDLKVLYPRRNLFHANEYAAFTEVLCLYFNTIGKSEQLESTYKSMKKTIPDAKETELIRVLMEPSSFQQLKERLISVFSKS